MKNGGITDSKRCKNDAVGSFFERGCVALGNPNSELEIKLDLSVSRFGLLATRKRMCVRCFVQLNYTKYSGVTLC